MKMINNQEVFFFQNSFITYLLGFKYDSTYDIYVYFDVANFLSSIDL